VKDLPSYSRAALLALALCKMDHATQIYDEKDWRSLWMAMREHMPIYERDWSYR
jgi:hypothetical protein